MLVLPPMKIILGLVVALSLMFSSVSAFALETKQEQRTAFEAMLAELKTHYGMIKFKEQQLGITYDQVEQKYLRLIDTATTLEEDAGLQPKVERAILPIEEFRQMMIGLAAEFKDGHTNILRQSKNAWTLGIRTAAIDGHLFVVGFNKTYFNANSTFPQLQIGDEVLEVDGRPVTAIAKENALYMSLATEASRSNGALEKILNVSGRWLRAKVTGAPVTVKFARAANPSQIIEGHFHWSSTKDYSDLVGASRYVTPVKTPNEKAIEKEKLKDLPYTFGDSSTTKTYFSEGLTKLGMPRGTVSDVGKLLNVEIMEAKNRMNAGMPHDSELASLEPIERLAAYTVRYNGKVFGVLRMPNYSPDSGFGGALNELRWLGQMVNVLEHSTDGLIIDQLSNGGGFVYEFSQFVRLFASHGEIATAVMDVKLSDTFFSSHSETVNPDEDHEFPVEGLRRNYSRMKLEDGAMQKMREAFARGEKWSGPVSFMGGSNEMIQNEMGEVVGQKDKVYSKPILLLNDGRSASGGDFMPAAMQASKRAIIMGETSMGLGGPVYRSQEAMPGSEMFMRCTMAYCVRADGLPIENMGVVPEVRRAIGIDDVKAGFGAYAHDVLEAAWLTAGGMDGATINAKLNEELVKRATAAHRGPISAAVEPASKMIAGFRAEVAKAALSAEKVAVQYEVLFAEFKKLDVTTMTEDEWHKLEIPLPVALTERDVLLSSMTDRASVLNRLNEMKNVAAIKADAGLLKLVTTLHTGLSGLGAVRFNGCMALLTQVKYQ